MPESDGRDAHVDRLGVTWALAVAHAAVFWSAFPGAGLWPLTFVSVVPLAWLALHAVTTRHAVLAVGVTQLAMWLLINRWLVAVTAAGYPALCVYMSVYPVLFVWILRRLDRGPAGRRLPAALIVPVVWVGLEFLRGEVFLNGYPWFLVAHPAVEWRVLAQSADLLGAYFVSFLVIMIGGTVIDVLRAVTGAASKRRAAVAMGVAVVAAGANLAYGGWRIAGTDHSPGPTVLVIQTNLPQDNKLGWPPPQQVEDMAQFVELTRDAAAASIGQQRRPQLIIWPETMLPGFGLEPDTIRVLTGGGFFPEDRFSRAVEDLALELETPVLVGSATYLGLRPQADRWVWDAHYNSAYLVLGRPPHQRYDKVFLTPFGETMPYISSWPWLQRQPLAGTLQYGVVGSRAIAERNIQILGQCLGLVLLAHAGGYYRQIHS